MSWNYSSWHRRRTTEGVEAALKRTLGSLSAAPTIDPQQTFNAHIKPVCVLISNISTLLDELADVLAAGGAEIKLRPLRERLQLVQTELDAAVTEAARQADLTEL